MFQLQKWGNRKKIMAAILGLLTVLLLLSGCAGKQLENPLNWEVQDFSFVNQEGQPLSKSDLQGKVWLADFIFTNCNTVCSPMTAHMADIQKMLKQQGLDVEFVSFTIDPERDKPEVLKQFGEKMNVDFANWHFLTGYTAEEIKHFSQTSFKSAVADTGDGQFLHGTSFYLVDQSGKIVKNYSGLERSVDEKLLNDIRILLDK